MSFNPVPALAPLSARLVAKLIDWLLFVPVFAAAAVLSVGAFGAALASLPAGRQAMESSRRLGELLGSTAMGAAAGTLALVAWGLAAFVVLFQWFLLCTRGQTVGKRLCAIRIVGLDGEPAGFVRALFLRQWVFGVVFTFAGGLVAAVIPVVGSAVWLIDYLPIFGAERRCLHDYLAGTQVRWVRACEVNGLRVAAAVALVLLLAVAGAGFFARAGLRTWLSSLPAMQAAGPAEPLPGTTPGLAAGKPVVAPGSRREGREATRPAAARGGFYRFTDDDGVLQIVDDLNRVPDRYRARAERFE